MAHDIRADLDQLFLQRRHGPVLYFPRQGQRPHEVAEIVSQGVKLKPDLVIAEFLAREARPPDGILAFLDMLFVSVRSGRGMGPVKRISHVEARPHKVLSFCW